MADDSDFARLEQALIEAGRSIDYPATPNLAARVRPQLPITRSRFSTRRPLRLRPALIVAVAVVIGLALLIAIPQTREAIAQILGLRTIHIIEAPPTPTVAAATPAPTPTPGVVPFKQCCPTTLAEAQRMARFKLLLPPVERPSQVFVQDQVFGLGSDAQQIIFVFGDPARPRFVLYQAQWWLYQKAINSRPDAGTVITETVVNGQRAVWLTGAPHILMTLDAQGKPVFDSERPVNANTLIWETRAGDTDTTYRLETPLSLAEAKAFAETLK